MKQSRKRIFYRVLAILLTAVCMTGCLPQIFRPSENSHSSQNSSQTASTLDSPESSSREYEQYDEQKLAEQKHFPRSRTNFLSGKPPAPCSTFIFF